MKKRQIKKLIRKEMRFTGERMYQINCDLYSLTNRIALLECFHFSDIKTATATRKATEVIHDTDPNYEAKKAEWFGKVEEAIIELNGMVQK